VQRRLQHFIDRRVAAALQARGQRILVDWDQLLLPPDALKTGAGEPYRVYGPFLRNWRGQVERRQAAGGSALTGGLEPLPPPQGLHDIDPAGFPEPRAALWCQLTLLETLPAHGELGQRFEGAEICPCRPGEAAAQQQLQAFCDGIAVATGTGTGAAGSGRIPLFGYEPGRNLPGEAGTSALSAALKFGTLSPRQALAAAQQARLVRTTLSDDRRDANTDAVAAGFQRALGQAMDADEDIETQAAQRYLSVTLRDARRTGLKLSARIEEMQLDGVLGTQRLPVLTAVLSAA
jgi:deoxyribodipyrimidine photolyase